MASGCVTKGSIAKISPVLTFVVEIWFTFGMDVPAWIRYRPTE